MDQRELINDEIEDSMDADTVLQRAFPRIIVPPKVEMPLETPTPDLDRCTPEQERALSDCHQNAKKVFVDRILDRKVKVPPKKDVETPADLEENMQLWAVAQD